MTTPDAPPSPGPPAAPSPGRPDAQDESAEEPRQQIRRVGLWGATQSGKSTFLSSLFIAAVRSPEEIRLNGNNDASTDFLIRNTHTLTEDHRFPDPTVQMPEDPLSWTLHMQVPNRSRGRFRRGPETVPFEFRIDLQDPPGRVFAAVPGAEPDRLDIGDDSDETTRLADFLAGCQGLLLFIDPIRERKYGDAHKYFHGTLLRIAQRVEAAGGKLPHHVAVCVTKLDDPSIFHFAREHGYLCWNEFDPLMFPRVHDTEAAKFMRELLTGSATTDVDLVQGALSKYFYPDRTQYFVTSAIGFFVGGPSSEFEEADPWNVVPDSDGRQEIRGPIHPINVAEPLLWLGERISAERQS
jgi:hypothetical protein